MADKDAKTEPGRTYVYWLSQACKKAREEGGLKQTDIPANQSKVSRFEKYAKWPADPEGLVQCYAQALEIKDSRVLWNFALDLWIEHGQPPRQVKLRRVPGIPESELLQRLQEGLPNDPARRRGKSRREDGQAGP